VLNGTKRFITNAPEAGIFTVMARTDARVKGAGGISAFVVERGTPGLSVGRPDRKMGQRGAHTADVHFDDCRVPAANLIGGREGVGFRTAMKVLDKGRLHIAAICTGAAQRMLDDALHYAIERRQFGHPIAEFQLVQAMLADSRAPPRRRRRRYRGSVVLQAVRLGDVRPRRGSLRADPRRRRLRVRSRDRAFLSRRPPVPHLRGDVADPAAGHRTSDDPRGVVTASVPA
jgi:alkylation response protein AidB-like acyl-CoA dehydrogenase